jgi:DNA repair exonuclease SbcCD ATPase subunit
MSNEPEISTPSKEAPPKKEKTLSAGLKDLLSQMEKLSSGEEKIKECLAFMRSALSDKAPRFKDYWEAKRICLPLFKEALPPQIRTALWGEYIEVSTEARHLKEILDDQSSFASEQINLAIQGVETDLEKYEQLLSLTPRLSVPESTQAVEVNREKYLTLQQELNLLNTLATRVNSLRKEVIKTEMRIRFKNKFFDRLSKAGDRIFPKRKELIKEISALFLADVIGFTESQFTPAVLKAAPITTLREEIKDLQVWAKELTLDTKTFSETRAALSKAWDILREYGEELKKESLERNEIYKKNVDLIMDKIKLLEGRCQAETFTIEEAMKQSQDILSFMKGIELGASEVRSLKEAVVKARAPVEERLKAAHQAREKEIQEAQRQRQDKIDEFKKRIQQATDSVDEKSSEELTVMREELQKQLNLLNLTHAEKELLEHSLKDLRDRIIDKKEKAIAALSEEERNSLQHLQTMLEEWKDQKSEIRTQLDLYRKALSGSGFDFEKAMRYRELIDAEKLRLDKINTTIEEIEAKIEELENS